MLNSPIYLCCAAVADSLIYEAYHIVTEDYPPCDNRPIFRSGDRIIEVSSTLQRTASDTRGQLYLLLTDKWLKYSRPEQSSNGRIAAKGRCNLEGGA